MRTSLLKKRSILLPIAFMAILLVSTLVVGFGFQPEKVYASVPGDQCKFIDQSDNTYTVCTNFVKTSLEECTNTYGSDTSNEDWIFCEQRVTAEVFIRYLTRAAPRYTELPPRAFEFCGEIQDTNSYDTCVKSLGDLRTACQTKYSAGSADLEFCYDRARETVWVEKICSAGDKCNYFAATGLYGTTADSGGPGFGDGDSTADGEPEKQSCEDNDGEFVFFQCAIIKGASEAVNELDARVRSALEVKPEYYENDGLKGAWANFRNIAYIVLIPVMLMMIIGTALGYSFIDAYTVKRALPRLLIAIIFIALSYEICVLLINIVDVIGKGTAGLIAAPFGGTDELTLTKIFNPSALSGATALGVGVIGGIALIGIGAVSLGIIASYLLVAALALIMIFALLTMREVIIVFLIILAPLAIISWIFPNNDKVWKLWWSSFSKLLLLYPIIVGLLVIGRAFALIISDLNAEGLEAVFLSFAKLVAYIGPFFFIPTIFRYAGGAFANLAGIVNNRSKGVFDRQRKYRGENRKATKERAAAGNRFKNTPGLRNFNKAAQYGANIKEAGIVPGRMRSNMDAAVGRNEHLEAGKFMKENETFAQYNQDDVVTKASLAGNDHNTIAQALRDTGDSRFQDEATVQQTAALIMKAKKEVGSGVYNKAAVRALAPTGTAFKDSGEMLEMINAVYGKDRQAAGAAAMEMKSASMGAGRVDIGGASAGATLGTLGQLYNGDVTRDQATRSITNSVLDSQPASTLIHPSMKPDYVRDNVVPVMQDRLRAAAAAADGPNATQADHANFMREMASVQKLQSSLAQTNPALSKVVGDEIMGMDLGLQSEKYVEREPLAGAKTQIVTRTIPDPNPSAAPGSTISVQEEVEIEPAVSGPLAPKKRNVQQLAERFSTDNDFRRFTHSFTQSEEDMKRRLGGAEPGAKAGTPPTPPI